MFPANAFWLPVSTDYPYITSTEILGDRSGCKGPSHLLMGSELWTNCGVVGIRYGRVAALCSFHLHIGGIFSWSLLRWFCISKFRISATGSGMHPEGLKRLERRDGMGSLPLRTDRPRCDFCLNICNCNRSCNGTYETNCETLFANPVLLIVQNPRS